MSGVNSINWARIGAQAVYYFYAYFKIGNGQPLSFSVPTGNFGDIYAGYLAKKLGLPIDKLIVATNKMTFFTEQFLVETTLKRKLRKQIHPAWISR